MLTVHLTGLGPLAALLGTLPLVALVIALVVAAFAAFVLVILVAAVLATAIVVVALLNGVGPFGPAFASKVTQLVSVALFKLPAHFTLCIQLYILKLTVVIGAVVHSSIVDRLEILGKSLKGLLWSFQPEKMYSTWLVL